MNAPPYLLALDLRGRVVPEKCAASVGPDGVTLRLAKQAEGAWGALLAEGTKAELKERREASLARLEAALQRQAEARREEQDRRKKEASNRNIALDSAKRRYIEQQKAEEKAGVEQELQDWERKKAGPPKRVSFAAGGETDSDEEEGAAGPPAAPRDHAAYYGRGNWAPSDRDVYDGMQPYDPARPGHPALAGTVEELDSDGGESAATESSSEGEEEGGIEEIEEIDVEREKENYLAQLPPPRAAAAPVQVSFTRLETKNLPARAHREKDIALWKKQNSIDPESFADALDVAERQPTFLKDKGDKFFKAGNFEGAISAYSRAISLDGDMVLCYNNRAACHLKLGEYGRCVEDCGKAIEKLEALCDPDAAASKEEYDKHRKALVKALVRRGTCRVKRGELEAAAEDYGSALKLDPGNGTIRRDLEEVRGALGPLEAAAVKERADSRFKNKDVRGAIQAYTMLLDLTAGVPEDRAYVVAGYSNRAACYLLTEEYAKAVGDCNAGIERVLGAGEPGEPGPEALIAEKRTADGGALSADAGAKLARILARRGTARSHLKEYPLAVQDFRAAAGLYRDAGGLRQAEALEADVAKLQLL